MREMIFWPPYTGPTEKAYTKKHVRLLESTLVYCKTMRTAVQAGGNIGYWPKRMSEKFSHVITFEPEPIMCECLVKNLIGSKNVEVRNQALGSELSRCGIYRQGFGSHRVIEGDEIEVVTIDSLELNDLDLLQLDIEGYEPKALLGGLETIRRCHPVIQVEILDEGQEIDRLMTSINYRKVLRLGRDHVFCPH